MKKANNYRTLLFLGILLECMVFNSLTAQWSTDPSVNNLITTVMVYDGQFVPVLVSDGAGGAIITWEDNRNADKDIYAQHISASGVVLGTDIAVSTATGYQSHPAIVSDGAGGAIIVWDDPRNSLTNTDIYAQRIDASGSAKWTVDGVAICTVAGDQISPALVGDGSGGAIITWVDQRAGNGTGYKLYAQRIDSSGTVHSGWTTNGVAICSNLTNTISLPTIVGDGSGGAIITWADFRNLNNYNIYAQRINASGDTLWKANGVEICTYVGHQGKPVIVSDGLAGAIIAWDDHRTSGDIYAQRIDASGTVQWTTDGVAIVSQPSSGQSLAAITSDGSGGAIITWIDSRSGFQDIYAQRINASGTVQWTADGIPVCAAADDQFAPVIVSDSAGGALISWYDFRDGNYNIYAQRIDANGDTLWSKDGVAISTYPSTQFNPSIASDGASGAIIAWYDYRGSPNGGTPNIYASQINANGSLGAGPLPVELVSFAAAQRGGVVELKWNTATEVNNYGFEVERKANGSQTWAKVGFVAGAGASTSPREYAYVDRGVSTGRYAYRIKQTDQNGTSKYTREVQIEVGSAPLVFSLSQNYPNPFNPSTTIEFSVPQDGRAVLKIVDLLGRDVATLFEGNAKSGYYQRVVFDASKLASGVYFSRLEFGGKQQLKKMILMK